MDYVSLKIVTSQYINKKEEQRKEKDAKGRKDLVTVFPVAFFVH